MIKQDFLPNSNVKEEARTCNMCKYFYRKITPAGHSWGKCEIGKSKYDCPAKHIICGSFESKENNE